MNNEMKHTPGPWRMDNRGETLVGSDGTYVTVWNSGISISQRSGIAEANARLIAAAPELLEACKEAEMYADNSEGLPQFVITLLIKAIAKAEGR